VAVAGAARRPGLPRPRARRSPRLRPLLALQPLEQEQGRQPEQPARFRQVLAAVVAAVAAQRAKRPGGPGGRHVWRPRRHRRRLLAVQAGGRSRRRSAAASRHRPAAARAATATGCGCGAGDDRGSRHRSRGPAAGEATGTAGGRSFRFFLRRHGKPMLRVARQSPLVAFPFFFSGPRGTTASLGVGWAAGSRVRIMTTTDAAAPPAAAEVPAPPGRRTHLCSACSFPVAAWGRLHPCRHAFCLTCATGHGLCFLCQSTIARVERVQAGGLLHISPVTLESFHSCVVAGFFFLRRSQAVALTLTRAQPAALRLDRLASRHRRRTHALKWHWPTLALQWCLSLTLLPLCLPREKLSPPRAQAAEGELHAHLAAARSRLGPIRVLPPPGAPPHPGGPYAMRPAPVPQPPPPGSAPVLSLPAAPYNRGGGRSGG